MATWVALLRAVNLAGTNRVSMPELRAALAQQGCDDVRSYLASGNVVFSSARRSATTVASLVAATVRDVSGHNIAVVVRTPSQLREALAANPFAEEVRQRPKVVQLGFLSDEPSTDGLDALRAICTTERLDLIGRHLYVDYSESIHGSKLTTALIERKLGVVCTARNFRTVQALLELGEQSRRS